MTINYQNFSRRNRERCESPRGFNHKLAGWSPSDWVAAIAGEVGEMAEALLDFGKAEASAPEGIGDKERKALGRGLADEIADVFTYSDLFAQSLGSALYPAPRLVTLALVSELATLEQAARACRWGSAHWLTPVVGALGEIAGTVKQLCRIRDGMRGNKPGTSRGMLETRLREQLSRLVCFLEHFANKCGIDMAEAIERKFDEISSRVDYVELQ